MGINLIKHYEKDQVEWKYYHLIIGPPLADDVYKWLYQLGERGEVWQYAERDDIYTNSIWASRYLAFNNLEHSVEYELLWG